MKDLKYPLSILIFYGFIGLMAYFVTPWALLLVLFVGFSERDNKKGKTKKK